MQPDGDDWAALPGRMVLFCLPACLRLLQKPRPCHSCCARCSCDGGGAQSIAIGEAARLCCSAAVLSPCLCIKSRRAFCFCSASSVRDTFKSNVDAGASYGRPDRISFLCPEQCRFGRSPCQRSRMARFLMSAKGEACLCNSAEKVNPTAAWADGAGVNPLFSDRCCSHCASSCGLVSARFIKGMGQIPFSFNPSRESKYDSKRRAARSARRSYLQNQKNTFTPNGREKWGEEGKNNKAIFLCKQTCCWAKLIRALLIII